tara:strand:+ start:208 stop:393 length:186 start_codon:yes stop_codon:yes gene_type:complete
MQLRLNPKRKEGFLQNKIVIKAILFILFFSIAIFIIDKIEKPAPYKLIKQKLGNDKLITVK